MNKILLPLILFINISFTIEIPFLWDSSDPMEDENSLGIIKPIILVNNQKKIASAWIEQHPTGLNIQTALFDPEKNAWSPPHQLTENNTAINSLSFTLDDEGNSFCIWSEKESSYFYLKVSHFLAENNKWSIPINISGIGKANIGNTSISTYQTNAYCSYIEKNGGYYYYKIVLFNIENNNWSYSKDITCGGKEAITSPLMKINENGTCIISFLFKEKNMWYIKTAINQYADGNNWKIETLQIPGSEKILDLKMDINSNGNCVLVWKELNEEIWALNSAIYEKEKNTWHIKEISTENKEYYTNISLSLIDEDALISWAEKNEHTWNLNAIILNIPTLSYFASNLSNNTASSIFECKLAVNSNFEAALVWLEQNNSGWEAKSSHFMPNIKSWSSPLKISDISKNKKGALSIHINSSNNALCSWIEKDKTSWYLKASYFTGNTWTSDHYLSKTDINNHIHRHETNLHYNINDAFCIWIEQNQNYWNIKTSTWDESTKSWHTPINITDKNYCEVCYAIISTNDTGSHICSFLDNDNTNATLNISNYENMQWDDPVIINSIEID